MAGVYIPNILLAIPRNPITAVGLPLALGFLSGSPASKVANSNWYHVGQFPLYSYYEDLIITRPESFCASGTASS